MAYGLIYQSSFDALKTGTPQSYMVKILKKNYTGGAKNITLSGNPVEHQWQTDDPRAAVRGSNLIVRIINDGSLPLSSFYSNEDDTFLCQLYWGDQNLFVGYLVQDDSSEIQIDPRHEIQLSFTDNLGLLKDVPLSQAAKILGPATSYNKSVQFGGNHLIRVYVSPMTISVGDTMKIENSIVADGIYTVTNVVDPGVGSPIQVTVLEFVTAFAGVQPALITVITPIDLSLRYTIKTFLSICLLSTNLQLKTRSWVNLHAQGTPTNFNQFDLYLNAEVFDGKSCYDVLTIILSRFEAVLFQDYGTWVIIRPDELRYFNNQPLFTLYADDFHRLPQGGGIKIFNYGNGSDIETGLLKSIFRPYKFVKKTFNYKTSKDLPRNGNLTTFGEIVSTITGTLTGSQLVDLGGTAAASQYVTAVYTVTYYDWIFWSDGDIAPFPNRRIRVVTDSSGQEVFRVGYLVNPSGDQVRVAKSETMEISIGDQVEWSFDIRTRESHTGILAYNGAGLYLDDGSTVYTLKADGIWNGLAPSKAGIIDIQFSGNTNTWRSYTIKSQPSLYAGLMRMYLDDDFNGFSPQEAQFKNIKITITPAVTELSRITGQSHKSEQSITINNSVDDEIFIDDSPRNAILGTIYLGSFTGVLQDRSNFWNRSGRSESRRLGDITTFEELFWRRIPRSKYEGTLLGLVQEFIYNYSGNIQFLFQFGENTMVFSSAQVVNFPVGAQIVITGTSLNDGTYTILTGTQNSTSVAITVVESVTNEGPLAASASITILQHLSLMTIIKNQLEANKSFNFGMLTIKYKDNQANGTIWEQWNNPEADSALVRFYEFKYLFERQ